MGERERKIEKERERESEHIGQARRKQKRRKKKRTLNTLDDAPEHVKQCLQHNLMKASKLFSDMKFKVETSNETSGS